jgi:hypothetical protein
VPTPNVRLIISTQRSESNIYNKPPVHFPRLHLPTLAFKHTRSGYSVRLRLVRIIRNPSIRTLVRAGEPDETRGCSGPAAGDLELVTAGVELRAGVRVRRVQGDDLVAHEVVPRLQAGGDRVGSDGGGFHERRRAPGVGSAGAAFFFDFEPDGTVGGNSVSRVLGLDNGEGEGGRGGHARTRSRACNCYIPRQGNAPCT